MKKTIFISVLSVILLITLFFTTYYDAYNVVPVGKEQLESIDTLRASCLMIVAHPDDETLWGGAHLNDDDYLVVCITNSSNKIRAEEFKNAMNLSDDQFLMLNYPDKVMFRRDDWKNVYNQIEDDIEKIISLKKWKLVVTHNPDGEYGHAHHIMTNNIVTSVYNKKEREYPMYYFGKYYKASQKEMIDMLEAENQIDTEKKSEMLLCYTSQKYVVRKFAHMCNYEKWTKYKKEITKRKDINERKIK